MIQKKRLTKIKFVNIFQGITLKLNDEGRCMIARIIHDGMIHRQGK